MTVRVTSGQSIHGHEAITLENDRLQITILPPLGGRIWSIVHAPTGRELLWHSLAIPPTPVAFGAQYDPVFAGGWDEVFPSDARVEIDGIDYPDHGEIWSVPATVAGIETTASATTVHLTTHGRVTGATFDRWITLNDDDAIVQIRYCITNHTNTDLPFLWKPHPALALNGPARLDLPARRIVVDAAISSDLIEPHATWPIAPGTNGPTDLREIPAADSGQIVFFNAIDIDAGWCAVTHTEERIGIGLVFDPQTLPYICVFGAFDTAHDINTIIVEPCTAYPYRLDHAITQGTVGHLAPGTTLDTTILAVVYTDLDQVSKISADGVVQG